MLDSAGRCAWGSAAGTSCAAQRLSGTTHRWLVTNRPERWTKLPSGHPAGSSCVSRASTSLRPPLLVLYPFFYLVIPTAPFLPLSAAATGALVAGVIGAAEVILLLAIALMGKEAYQAIKARVFKRSKRSPSDVGVA